MSSAASSAASSQASSASGTGTGTGTAAASGSIVIGSANFPESALIANIYAAALTAKGVDATTQLNIGERAVYLKALQDGSIDLVPEYSGVLLQYFDKTATATSSEDVYAALEKGLRSHPIGLRLVVRRRHDRELPGARAGVRYRLVEHRHHSVGQPRHHHTNRRCIAAPETCGRHVPHVAELFGDLAHPLRGLTFGAGKPLVENARHRRFRYAGSGRDVVDRDPPLAILRSLQDQHATGFVRLRFEEGALIGVALGRHALVASVSSAEDDELIAMIDEIRAILAELASLVDTSPSKVPAP